MRHGVLGAVLLAGLARSAAAAAGGPAMDATDVRRLMTDEHRHVRTVDARIGRALADGLERSPTLAQLVLALERSDVIAYVEFAIEMHPSLAGRMLLTATPQGPRGLRYVRIQIAPSLRGNELTAIIGHELQHALEVAESPEVRDEAGLVALYRAIGRPERGGERYDTIAAQHAGRRVRTELIG